MKLISLKYSLINANIAGYDDWYLEELCLSNFNLIVGENSVGKSRTVQLISSFAKMVSQETSILFFGKWTLTFRNNNNIILYQLDITNSVVSEKLYINKKLVLDRDNESTQIFSFTNNKLVSIKPPKNKLVLHVRRDVEEYPFFEDIINWAQQLHGFKFGNITPNTLLIDKKADRLTSIDEIPLLLEELKQDDYNKVIQKFNSLGYLIERISTQHNEIGTQIIVFQKGLNKGLLQHQLSQGMFRALSLLIFIQYLISKNKVTTLIIDDFCEGLDYQKATKLGKLIANNFMESNIQFIVTSNDSFLMDVIPIKYWNILHREGNVVKSFNYQNSKELFDNFAFTGLSNFDLFSSDYLLQKT